MSQFDPFNAQAYDLSIVIGRFQPFHNGHENLVNFATKIAKRTAVLVGSSHIARDCKNPFTFNERIEMISGIFPNIDIISIIDDLYSDQVWIAQIQSIVNDLMFNVKNPRVCIVGHHKDSSSWYLDAFPKYDYQEVDSDIADGTTLRNLIFADIGDIKNLNTMLHDKTRKYIFDWILNNKKEYIRMREEFQVIREYKEKWLVAPYPPTFVTTDAVVICNGHLLLIKRRMAPGKGLWALPGGFLNQNETIADGTIRELVEETRIKVSEENLRANVRGTHVFDAPGRSLRGRTITHASLIVLHNKELPKVRGSDDAERAKWIPISEFYNMTDQMFEDHYSIASYMINRA